MEIPSLLVDQVREGKVVLVLGAGASGDSKSAKGEKPPNGKELGERLSDKFLGGEYKTLPLNQIGDLAVSESDLITVQEYIRSVFEAFEPSSAHRLMCLFSWWGLATTNYDRLIERAYETTPGAIQAPQAFIENGDRVEDRLRDPQNVMLLKLHGCITRTTNPDCPLILTTDQYIEYRRGRSRIFDHLKSWALERTVVFVGHSLQDTDLRTILLELASTESRPRYFIVAPDVDDIQRRFWEAKRITPLAFRFDDFMRSLDDTIPRAFRGVTSLVDHKLPPISGRFKIQKPSLSRACQQFLETDVEYVNALTAIQVVSPAKFYRGFNQDFSAVEQKLDCPRHLTDTILSDVFLAEESEHRAGMELVLVKAHAGAGKTVLMRRIAWDAAHDYNRICLYLRPHGLINTAAIQELIGLCNERIYLFVDDAADRMRELRSLGANIGPEGRLLTVLVSERINEWNITCESLSPFLSSSYELKYLSSKEIDSLLLLLEQYHALGTLERAGKEERKAAFADRAGRQLLVALHEATLGKPFEDIIEDEFNHIQPYEAQQIYLTICVLNRFNVPVRAGIIARIHGVPFEEFKKRLFAPLELIVAARLDPVIRDYVYEARHPHIAQIVFERILTNVEERYEKCLTCLRELNIDYSTDWRAFRQLVRARTLIDLFPDPELVKMIYQVARDHVGEDAYLLHQMAIYQMNQAGGNLDEAAMLLSRASALSPLDSTIKHSLAELRLREADISRTPLERDKLLTEASLIAASLKSKHADESYAYHTLAKVGLKRLEAVIENPEEDALVGKIVKDIETELFEGLQKSPGDSYLLEADAKLADLLGNSIRVLGSLDKAFQANPRNAFLAIRLAGCYRNRGDSDKALNVLQSALEANPTERRLHYSYAMLLRLQEGTKGDELAYHLQRAFTPGDTNYDAQLLYGRQLFINGDRDGSKVVFARLRNALVPSEVRDRLLYPLDQTFRGSIARMEATYCFIARDGQADWLYAHRNNVESSVWKDLIWGSRVSFRIAFALRGVNAFDVDLEF